MRLQSYCFFYTPVMITEIYHGLNIYFFKFLFDIADSSIFVCYEVLTAKGALINKLENILNLHQGIFFKMIKYQFSDGIAVYHKISLIVKL